MVVSAAKLEANRRNAQKSTGPRTEEGKDRSKLNAVKHGMRAETLVLLDEDPQALEDRRAAWRPASCPATTSSSGPSTTPSFTRGCKTAPGEPRPAGSMPTSPITESTRARPTRKRSTTWAGGSSRIGCGPLVFYPSPTTCKRFDYDREPEHVVCGRGKGR